jgi:F420-dependent oxidoreductase-like protein
MTAISIMIEGQMGLTWPRWQRLVAEVEGLGFAGLFRSDHFTNARPPDEAALEMTISLAYVASHTTRLHFGPLVAPVSFRDPVQLARQAAALDDLSGGRMILGLGAGWQEREHHMFGYELGDIPTRMARLEEGLEVVTRLLRSDEPVTYEGRFYHLRDAILLPPPARPGGPTILIGGNGPQRTLPLAARYAGIWNAIGLSPDDFRGRSATLDELLRAAGRQPGDVRRTMMTTLFFGRDTNDLNRLEGLLRRNGWFKDDQPLAAQLESWRTDRKAVVGTPDTVIAQIQAYAAAGVEELMFQWLDMDDMAGLRSFAERVLPHLG